MPTVPASTRSEPPHVAASARPVPLCEPQLGGNEWTYMRECLETGWVSSAGPFVERFERQVASYVGASHGVATVNGTSALHTALLVVGVEPGDEVLVSDLTFIAPVNAVRYCGAHPILVDADARTWQMDVDKAERFLMTECELQSDHCVNRRTGRRVRAIVPVHILGLACAMDRIVELARRYRLRIVEDAAEAMGVRYRARHVGTFGDIGVFSFNGNKIVTAGGGGMVVTNHAPFARQARYLTTQARDDEAEYIHRAVGYNYRLSNLQAALGTAQMEQVDRFIQRKREIAAAYEDALRDIPGLTAMPRTSDTASTCWLYTVLLPEGTTVHKRQEMIETLHGQGIGVRPLWYPIHGLAPYRNCQTVEIEHATMLHARGLSLPSGAGLTPDDQRRCIDTLRTVVA